MIKPESKRRSCNLAVLWKNILRFPSWLLSHAYGVSDNASEQNHTEVFEIPKHQIDMQHGKVIRVRKGSRFISATVASDAVIIQTFEGNIAKQQWEETVWFNQSHLYVGITLDPVLDSDIGVL
jgi:hypothetical protein